MENKKRNVIAFLKNCSKKVKVLFTTAAFLLLIGVICFIVFAPSGDTTISVETSLKEVFETSELSTSEFIYNSIVKVPIDSTKPIDDNNIKYCVAYKGTAKYGFDFNKIEIIEEKNSIIVIIPKIVIQSVNVDADLDYIFSKPKYDTETTYAEAKELCRNDLEKKSETSKTFYDKAVENAIETVKVLTKPFENQIENEKTIQVVYIDDFAQEEKQ